MEKLRDQRDYYSEKEERQPAPDDVIKDLLSQSTAIEETDSTFVKLASEEEFQALLHYLQSTTSTDSRLVCAGYSDAPTELSGKEITISSGRPREENSKPRSLEESWVMVDPDYEAAQWALAQGKNLNHKPGFFEDWPSFGVYDYMAAVVKASGAYFMFGYTVGATCAINSLTQLCNKHPGFAFSACVASSYAATLFPHLAFKAVQYIAIGSLVAGSAVSAPLLVLGTSGVFVAATTYHSFEAFKRAGKAAIGTKPPPAVVVGSQ